MPSATKIDGILCLKMLNVKYPMNRQMINAHRYHIMYGGEIASLYVNRPDSPHLMAWYMKKYRMNVSANLIDDDFSRSIFWLGLKKYPEMMTKSGIWNE